ncbi:MAG: TolC family protein [Cytophagales bacterium]|nr:TolC family protein [Cytophagales bacterium]
MKYVYLFALMLSVSMAGMAQEPGGTSFTLEQCIAYALQNSVRSKNAELDQRIARAKVNETIGIGLPQVSGSASITSNPQLPRFFTTYNGPGGFLGDLSSVPGLQVGDVIAAQNFFQLKNAGNAGLSVNQLIFNGSYLVGLQAANTYKDLAVKKTEQTKEDIIQQVMKAYYAVLINKERITLFSNNIGRVDSLFRNTTALNKNGFAERIDVDRVKVTLNNLITERDKFMNLNELGIQLLKFQMNYPHDQPIEVVGKIQEMAVDTKLDSYQMGWDYRNRPDYKVLEVNQRLQRLNIRNQYAEAIPVLSAFANLGYTTQSPSIAGIFSTNSSFSEAGAIGPDRWYGFSQIGVSLNVPLFTGLSRNYRIQQEKLKLLQIDNGFINLRNAIDLEIKQASLSFDNAIKTLASQQENQELAGNVARVTKIKYEQGVGSSLEVTDAENNLRQAQTNYYTALFDAMVAKVDLDKAFGKLLPSTYDENTQIKSDN